MRNHGMLPLIAGALIAAILPARADDRTPSLANGCGRLEPVAMTPIPSTHRTIGYPLEAQRRRMSGHDYLRVLVDKYGAARQVEVVVSSGYAILDQAAIDAIKDRWRWEPPPPECQENGVILGVAYNWGLNEPDAQPIYIDNSIYPAEARARKQGGTGEVAFTVSGNNKVIEAHVSSSTGSPELDAAMLALVRDFRVITSGTASADFTERRRFKFVPRPNPDNFAALMGPAIIPPLAELSGKPYRFSRIYSLTAPSRANNCGRDEEVFLEQSLTNPGLAYPIEAAAAGMEGRTMLDVLVDRGGTASEVTVAQSSGSSVLDQAAVQGVKGIWHWEAPPPECADTGVHLRVRADWFRGEQRLRYMPGDRGYPAEAVTAKLSGSGRVTLSRSSDGDLVSAKVVTSTNSPVLDAAMVKVATDLRFTPGTKEMRQPATITIPVDFVGDPAILLATTAVSLRRTTPRPPAPSTANDCGRNGAVYLAPIDTSHVLIPIPVVATKPKNRRDPVYYLRAQGGLRMHVLVDKDGKAASVTVAQSSAPPEMERAVTSTVKERYRWEAPPPECAQGVALDVEYVYTWAAPQLQIYADDPLYPDAARQRIMGVPGIVEVTYRGDEIYGTKILVSGNSPELDERMIKLVTDQVLPEIKTNARRGFVTQAVPVMFMPPSVVSPKQQAAAAFQSAAAMPAQ